MRMLFAAVLVFAVAGGASAIVVDFDDLVGQNPVPDGYGGINWPGWMYYDAEQPPYNPSSPPCRVYAGGDVRFYFLEDSYLIGAFFNGHGSGDGFEDPFFMGYYNGGLVGTSETLYLDGSGTGGFLASGFEGLPVDEVFVGGSAGWWIMDDLTYEIVPEPAAVTGLAGLILGIGGILWRRK